MGKVVKFVLKSTPIVALKRVKKRKKVDPEDFGQLNLFTPKDKSKIVSMPSTLSPFEEALVLDEQGNMKAGELYYQAISAGECVADAYCNLGILEFKHGKKAEAIDCFTKSLKHDPRHFESHYNLANLYSEVENIELAKLHYEVASRILPDSASVYYNLGIVYALNNEFEKSVLNLTRYIGLVSEKDGMEAKELLASLKESLDEVL